MVSDNDTACSGLNLRRGEIAFHELKNCRLPVRNTGGSQPDTAQPRQPINQSGMPLRLPARGVSHAFQRARADQIEWAPGNHKGKNDPQILLIRPTTEYLFDRDRRATVLLLL